MAAKNSKAGAVSVMEAMQDPKNWKKTRDKLYYTYVCMPKVGSNVNDKTTGVKTQTDSKKRYVMSGTIGETKALDAGSLSRKYEFADGAPISSDALKKRAKKVNGEVLIDWVRVRNKRSEAQLFAFHLDPKKYGQQVRNLPIGQLVGNQTGIGHGVGDFLVCPANADGTPNIKRVSLVNGQIFPNMYDMHGFPGLINTEDAKDTPVPKSILAGIKVDKKAEAAGGKAKTAGTGTAAAKKEPPKPKYTAVGRIMSKGKIVGMKLSGQKGEFSATKEQVCLLVGRGDIDNIGVRVTGVHCDLIGKKNLKLTDLPEIEGALKKEPSESAAKASAPKKQAVVPEFTIVSRLMKDGKIVGYAVSKGGSGKTNAEKGAVLRAAKDGRFTNARVQMCKGKVLLRARGDGNLKDLPEEQLGNKTLVTSL